MMEECSNFFKSKKNKQHTGLVPQPTGAYPFFLSMKKLRFLLPGQDADFNHRKKKQYVKTQHTSQTLLKTKHFLYIRNSKLV